MHKNIEPQGTKGKKRGHLHYYNDPTSWTFTDKLLIILENRIGNQRQCLLGGTCLREESAACVEKAGALFKTFHLKKKRKKKDRVVLRKTRKKEETRLS